MDMIKRLFLLLAAVTMLILSGCDNGEYTEYGGDITTIDGSEISSMVVSQALSSAQSFALSSEMASQIESRREAATATSLHIFDRQGNIIEVPEQIDSIISLSRDATEILVGLGLTDSIIAADIRSADVGGIAPSICTLDTENPDVQAITQLSPDLTIVSVPGDSFNTMEELEKRGLYAVYVPESTGLEGKKLDIEFLAALTGRKDEGETLIAEAEAQAVDIAEDLSLSEEQAMDEIQEE
jgi:ABC-type Fe3+-hydroxamate transport system substrate-binding protein